MKVILTKDVDTLGQNGDILNVSEGFARNYLFPKNVAVIATSGALRDLDKRIERIRQLAEKKHAMDMVNGEKITALGNITLTANAGDSGKLFGTITTKELAGVIVEKTGLSIDRKQVNVSKPINHVGQYTVFVKISPKLTTSFGLTVVAENDDVDRPVTPSIDDAFDTGSAPLELGYISPSDLN